MGTNNPGTSQVGVRGFALGPFETNCYVVRVGASTGCWIIDAGYEPGELIGYTRQAGLTPAAIVLTHAHADHIAGVRAVLDAFPGTPLWIHGAEREWLRDPQLNLSAAIGMAVTAPDPDATLTHGQQLELDGSIGYAGRDQAAWMYGLEQSGWADLRGSVMLNYDWDDRTTLQLGLHASTIVASTLDTWFDDLGIDSDVYWVSLGVNWHF